MHLNGLRIELHFSGEPPTVCFKGASQQTNGTTITLLGNDTPLLRAQVVELLLAHPHTQLGASPCFVGKPEGFTSAHDLVRQACDAVSPEPLSYNLKDAAKRLGVSYSYLRRLVYLGSIKKVRGRITATELQRYIKEVRPGR